MLRGASVGLGTVHADVLLNTKGLEEGKARAARTLKDLGKEMETLVGRANSLGRGLTIGLTAPLAAFGATSVRAAAQMDSLKRGLTAVAGSSEAAERQLKSLKEVAKLPGLGMEEAVQGSIRLQAAGLNAQFAERSLRAFGNALATVGKGKADLDGVLMALTQIEAKGKVSAEEINQLAERLPQIRKAMEAAFGTSNTEELQKRGMTSTQFLGAIVTEFEKIPKVAGGAQNSFENFGDALKALQVTVGNVFLPTITKALESMASGLETVTNWFGKLHPAAQTALGGIGTALAVGGPVLMGLSAIWGWLDKIGKLAAFRFLFSPGGAAAGVAIAAGAVGINEARSIGAQADAARRALEADRRRMQEFERAGGGRQGLRALFGGMTPAEQLRNQANLRAQAGNVYDPLSGQIRPMAQPADDFYWHRLKLEQEAAKKAAEQAEDAKREAARLKTRILDYMGERDEVTRILRRAQQDLNAGMPRAEVMRRRNEALRAAQPRDGLPMRGPVDAGSSVTVWRMFQQAINEQRAEVAQQMEELNHQLMTITPTRTPALDKGGFGMPGGAESLGIVRELDALEKYLEGQKRVLDVQWSLKFKPREVTLDPSINRSLSTQVGDMLRTAVDQEAVRKKFRDGFRFMNDLAAEIGSEFYYGFRDRLGKLFGGGTLGRILGNALTRSLSRTLDTALDSIIGGLMANANRGVGKGIASGEHALTWGSLGGPVGMGLAAFGLGKLLGGGLKGLFRAHGGPVAGGVPYVVGERGPELFIPSRAGYVVPNGAMAGAGNVIVQISGPVVRDEISIQRLAQEVGRQVSIAANRGARVRPGSG